MNNKCVLNEVAQLLLISAGLIGTTAFCAWLTSANSSGLFSPEYFLTATLEQLQKIVNFSDSLYKSMMSMGIIIGAAVNVAFAVGVMAMATCIKYRMNTETESRTLNINDNTSYGTVNFEL